MKHLSIILLLVCLSACAPIHVNYDYDTTINFNDYKTYNYYQPLNTGLSDLDTKRLINILDVQMQEKGLTLSDTPDFLVNIQSSELQQAQRSNVGVGMGGGGGNVGGGISIGIPVGQANINRQIVFDFVDEDNKGLFWQADSESSYNPNAYPDDRTAQLKKIVVKVLSKYPPEKK